MTLPSRRLIARCRPSRLTGFPSTHLAIRAQVGWLSVFGLRGEEEIEPPIEVLSSDDPIFSRAGGGCRPKRWRSLLLSQRIRPALSRVKKLAIEAPALLIVFDLPVGADGRAKQEPGLSVLEPLSTGRYQTSAVARKKSEAPDWGAMETAVQPNWAASCIAMCATRWRRGRPPNGVPSY